MNEMEGHKANIKVFGCGVSGTNIVQKIHDSGIPGIETLAVTDNANRLIKTTVNKRILTGIKMTSGLGGCDLRAIERDLVWSDSYIRENLKGYDTIVLTGGLGGRSSSVIPGYISKVAKEINPMGIVIGIVTLPSDAEGKVRKDNARYGLKKMMDSCDAIIVISIDSLDKMYRPPLDKLFGIADVVLKEIINRIIDVMNREIEENGLDVLREIFGKGKMGTIGIGESEDPSSPIEKATEEALDSPLILGDMKESETVLMIISGGREISQPETEEAANLVKERIDQSAKMKIYTQLDDDSKNTVDVILLILG